MAKPFEPVVFNIIVPIVSPSIFKPGVKPVVVAVIEPVTANEPDTSTVLLLLTDNNVSEPLIIVNTSEPVATEAVILPSAILFELTPLIEPLRSEITVSKYLPT